MPPRVALRTLLMVCGALTCRCGTVAATTAPEAVQVVARFLRVEAADLRLSPSERWGRRFHLEPGQDAYEAWYCPTARSEWPIAGVCVDRKLGMVTRAVWPPTSSEPGNPAGPMPMAELERLASEFMRTHPPTTDAAELATIETQVLSRSPGGDTSSPVRSFRFATVRKADGVPFARQTVKLDAGDGRVMEYALSRVHTECFERLQVTREAAIEKARAALTARGPAGVDRGPDAVVLSDSLWPDIKPGEAPVWVLEFRARAAPDQAPEDTEQLTVTIHGVSGDVISIDGCR